MKALLSKPEMLSPVTGLHEALGGIVITPMALCKKQRDFVLLSVRKIKCNCSEQAQRHGSQRRSKWQSSTLPTFRQPLLGSTLVC